MSGFYEAGGRQMIVKDPDALKDYQLDWAAFLDSDTITAVEWIVPAGLTKASESHTDTTATVWLSGGTATQTYPVTCRVTTAGGRIDDRTFYVICREQ